MSFVSAPNGEVYRKDTIIKVSPLFSKEGVNFFILYLCSFAHFSEAKIYCDKSPYIAEQQRTFFVAELMGR